MIEIIFIIFSIRRSLKICHSMYHLVWAIFNVCLQKSKCSNIAHHRLFILDGKQWQWGLHSPIPCIFKYMHLDEHYNVSITNYRLKCQASALCFTAGPSWSIEKAAFVMRCRLLAQCSMTSDKSSTKMTREVVKSSMKCTKYVSHVLWNSVNIL